MASSNRNRKKTSVKKKAPPKKTKTTLKRLQKLAQQLIDQFFKRAGCISGFIVVFVVLIIMLFLRWNDYSGQPDPQEEVFQGGEITQGAFFAELAPISQQMEKQYGLKASVSLGQAALESDYGRSELAAQYNNLYGVKTSADDPNGIDFLTMEYSNNAWVEITDRFKVYPSWQDAVVAHAELLYYGVSWDSDYYQPVLEAESYQDQARALQEVGYATDPTYGDKIIDMIETWDLNQYDQP